MDNGGVLPAPADKVGFEATSWTTDGRRLAGLSALLSDNSSLPDLLVYSFDTNKYAVFKEVIPAAKTTPTQDVTVWMNDDRRLLLMNGGRLTIVDTQSGKSHLIFNQSDHNWLSLPGDNRWLYMAHRADEADVWLATLK